MRVIFIGTGDLGVPVLEALSHDKRFTIPCVITGQDKKAGRKLQITFSPIKEAALKNKLIVQQSRTISDLKQKIIQENPDFLLVISYGEIIKKDILEIPKFGAINIHPSLLPKYRGPSPVQETILHGDNETGVTWIRMTQKMDAGPIIACLKIPVSTQNDFTTLTKKLQSIAANETGNVLEQFYTSQISTPQNDAQATYCKKISKNDGLLSPQKENAEYMMRKIRAYAEWPGCFLELNRKRIKIIQAKVGEQKISSGEIQITDNKILAIGTLKGTLLPTIVKPESKREMTIEEFLRGQQNILKTN